MKRSTVTVMSPEVLLCYAIGDIVATQRDEHVVLERVVSIDHGHCRMTIEPLGWFAKTWYQVKAFALDWRHWAREAVRYVRGWAK